MAQKDYVALFRSLYPDFFEREDIRGIPNEEVFAEMILRLDEFDPDSYSRKLDGAVSFGFYEGGSEEIRRAVVEVEPDWVRYYDGSERIFCGFVEGDVVSFCLVSDMGAHQLDGRQARIGGPGCVGTLPQYRDRGIGLTMVKHVTAILEKEGYDYSYIHYTYLAPWYARLGYQTCVSWTRNGVI